MANKGIRVALLASAAAAFLAFACGDGDDDTGGGGGDDDTGGSSTGGTSTGGRGGTTTGGTSTGGDAGDAGEAGAGMGGTGGMGGMTGGMAGMAGGGRAGMGGMAGSMAGMGGAGMAGAAGMMGGAGMGGAGMAGMGGAGMGGAGMAGMAGMMGGAGMGGAGMAGMGGAGMAGMAGMAGAGMAGMAGAGGAGNTATGVMRLSVPLMTASTATTPGDGQRYNVQNRSANPPAPYDMSGATLTIRAYAPDAIGGNLAVFFRSNSGTDSPIQRVGLSTLNGGFVNVDVLVPAATGNFNPTLVDVIRIEVEANMAFGTSFQSPATIVYIDSITSSNSAVNLPFNTNPMPLEFGSSAARPLGGSMHTWLATYP